ncbi:response regulator [Gracilibacillus sp. YIM 98692]|uniref:response regulator transcription factor n=1 Tax=Gracilibacillus sp. YIM 98692 TaxID=2663532 RepID=UPI0013D06557|nr:response regulator [Gracilibacillus sp. YIM 98692]
MYKILLVDDEINILEGISELVDWEKCDTELIGKASNGIMALDLIKEQVPDIIITDIRMPGMDGMELMEKVHDQYPQIQFVILSGYNEFEYAKTAMKFGAKHYLLKPSNEHKIFAALEELIEERNEKEKREQTIRRIIPKAKEQLLRDFIMGKEEKANIDSILLELPSNKIDIRLVMLMLDGQSNYEKLQELKVLVDKHIHPLKGFCTVVAKYIVFLTDQPLDCLKGKIAELHQSYGEDDSLSFSTCISRSGTIDSIPWLYKEAEQCLEYRFYFGKGSVIASDEKKKKNKHLKELAFEHQSFFQMIKQGKDKDVQVYLRQFFNKVRSQFYDKDMVKAECLGLLFILHRQLNKRISHQLNKSLAHLNQLTTLDDMEAFIMKESLDITKYFQAKRKKPSNVIIDRVEDYVESNLDDESLSISKIANEVFFINPDYLGKLFKRETGQKFSIYLIEKRVEKAMELIQKSDEMKIQAIAKNVGFGKNPGYFGQVFKKYTGYTPTEFKTSISDGSLQL